jgi:GNAT superfamily N-acetyltransferase
MVQRLLLTADPLRRENFDWVTGIVDHPERQPMNPALFHVFVAETTVQLVGAVAAVPPVAWVKAVCRAHAGCDENDRALQGSLLEFLCISAIGVHVLARRQGVGSRLLTAAEDALRHIGCKLVTLEYHPDSPGVAEFYEKLGYRVLADDEYLSLDCEVAAVPYRGKKPYRTAYKALARGMLSSLGRGATARQS